MPRRPARRRQKNAAARLQASYDKAVAATSPHVESIGKRLEAEKAKVAGMQATSDAADSSREGRQYVPYYSSEQKGGLTGIAQRRTRRRSERRRSRSAPPRVHRAKSLLNAEVPDNTTGLVARAWQRQIRYASTDTFRREIAQAGSDVRRSNRDVLVHTQALKTAKIPDNLRTILDQKVSTLDELHGAEGGFEGWRQALFGGHPDPLENCGGIGAEAPKGYEVGRQEAARPPRGSRRLSHRTSGERPPGSSTR